MNHLPPFFVDNIQHYPHVALSHNIYLVLLSILVAIFASTLALHTTQVVKLAKDTLQKQLVIAIGSLALGLGIWCMHFIGILSMTLPITIRFNYVLTLLSLIPSWIAAAIIFSILSRPKIHHWQLVLSGILVGSGIGTMHYLGMYALNSDVAVRYNPLIFGLSIVVAVVFSTISLWIRFGLNQANTRFSYLQLNIISGTIMGLAISSMHYMGMHATYFIGMPNHAANSELILDTTSLSILLATFAVSGSILIAFVGSLMRFKQLFIQLQENDSKTQTLVDTAVDGIIVINGKGIIQSFNQSAERLFGWKASEMVGKNINTLMPEPYSSHHDGYLKHYLDTNIAKIIGSGREIEGLRKDGSVLPIRLAVGRVPTKTEPLFVGFVTDITDRKKLEQSLRKSAEEAKKAAVVKTAFLANMSHEIRTPLNAIIGFTDILLQTPLNDEQQQHLCTIQRSSKSLLALLNDILDTTKLEKGSFELENIDFSLYEVAKQVTASLSLSAQSKGLQLNLDYDPLLSPYFNGDPLRIQQILTNLIGNAIKFTEQGHVTLRIYPDQHYGVHIEVRDTGIGMTTNQQKRIFDSFVQGDASISRRFGGTGLGTTISKQLVDLMGGKIHVESTYQKGSTFHVFLPLPIGNTPANSNNKAADIDLPPLNILIADDVPQNIELLKLILERNNHQVVSTLNGNDVFELFKHQHFDVILMDVHMPDKDGLTTAREIRIYEQAHHLAPTPIIALTASVMEADRQAAKNAGMNGFAIKPIDPKRLNREIARILKLIPGEVIDEEESIANDQTINWSKGVTLWGSRSNLVNAIKQFTDSIDINYPLPAKEDSSVDWSKAQMSLHSIKGAAGNLCLPAIFKYAAQLEDMVKQKQTDNFFIKLNQLKNSIAHVKEMPELLQIPKEYISLNTISLEDILQQIQSLIDKATNNEIDDEALTTVEKYLTKHDQQKELANILKAFDRFDFETACHLLRLLQQQLEKGEHL